MSVAEDPLESTWVAVTALSSGVAALVVVVGTFIALRSLREAERARSAATLLQFQAWQSSEAAKSFRRRLYAGEVFWQHSDADRAALEDAVDQHEFLGMLVARRLVDAEVAATFYRYSPRRVWEHALDFIESTRVGAPGYGLYLQALVEGKRPRAARRFVRRATARGAP